MTSLSLGEMKVTTSSAYKEARRSSLVGYQGDPGLLTYLADVGWGQYQNEEEGGKRAGLLAADPFCG